MPSNADNKGSETLFEVEAPNKQHQVTAYALSFSDILLLTLLIYAIYLLIRKIIKYLNGTASRAKTPVPTHVTVDHEGSIGITGITTEFVHIPQHYKLSVKQHTSANNATSNNSNVTHLYVMIPGNPGVSYCYLQFVQTLLPKLQSKHKGEEVAIVVVGFAGHLMFTSQQELAPIKLTSTLQVKDLYTINDQIEHKIAVIEKLQEQFPNAQVSLMGHSIGSYIIMQVRRWL